VTYYICQITQDLAQLMVSHVVIDIHYGTKYNQNAYMVYIYDSTS